MIFILLLLAIGIILLPLVALSGWITMLCLGALAHIFGFWALAIGFWPSILVSIILGVLFG